MPGFGHLLRADARQPAPKHRIWEFFLETDVHQPFGPNMWLVWCLVILVGICLLLSMVDGPIFQAMNAGKSEKA
jgi:hypothetical protein